MLLWFLAGAVLSYTIHEGWLLYQESRAEAKWCPPPDRKE